MQGSVLKQVIINTQKRLENLKYIINICKIEGGINDNNDYTTVIIIIKADYKEYVNTIYRIELEFQIFDGKIIHYINHNNISVSGSERIYIKNIKSEVIDNIYDILSIELKDNFKD